MRCPRTVPRTELKDCGWCDGRGVGRERHSCERCEGSGQRNRVLAGHGEYYDCELCDGTMFLRADLAEWVAERTMAAMPPEAQRGIVALHNAKQLVEPPRVLDEQSIVFSTKGTAKAERLTKKLVPGVSLSADPTDLRVTWFVIPVAGPSVEAITRRFKEIRKEADDAAA